MVDQPPPPPPQKYEKEEGSHGLESSSDRLDKYIQFCISFINILNQYFFGQLLYLNDHFHKYANSL